MKPFRKHLAIAIDGGGIRGLMVTKALEAVEKYLGKKLGEVCELAVGTSTGSLIAAGIALNHSAAEMTRLYREMAPKLFKRTWRYYLWPFVTYRYPNDELKRQLDLYAGDRRMKYLWGEARQFDLVITARDLREAKTLFIKPYKEKYRDWTIKDAVLASTAAPTFLPVIKGRYIDGGVGSYGNPCYIAAYESTFCRGWKPEETTLLSLGTGRPSKSQKGLPLHHPDRFNTLQWIPTLIDSFLLDANDQQARVVFELFKGLDFRRFQIETRTIWIDDPSRIDELIEYGVELGRMILEDRTDSAFNQPPELPSTSSTQRSSA